MIDLQGWMYWQQTDKISILGKPSWKRRWVVLTPDVIFIYKTDKEGSNPPIASYALSSFETCVILEPTKKSPSALSLIPSTNPNRRGHSPIPRSNRSTSASASTLMRKTRRQSIPSSPSSITTPYNHNPVTSPVLLRAEPGSPVSLHEWQRSINDRIKDPFPTNFYEPSSPPPPPVPKIPYGTVSMYTSTPIPNANRSTMPSSTSHKSLSQSVTSNLSAALSSVTSPSSRRKSRALSPSDMKRVRDGDQASMRSNDSATPPPSSGFQQGYFDDDSRSSLPTAEKVLEQTMRFHQQRRQQARWGGPTSPKSESSFKSEEMTPSSPGQALATPPNLTTSTMPAIRSPAPATPTLAIANFEVLIKELEEEEAERKRKREIPVPTTSSHQKKPSDSMFETAQPRPRRPSALNEAKRRSTGSILFNPSFVPIDKENSFPMSLDKSAISQSRRVSIASFGSEHSESKRNSAHEVTFNFVDWSGMGVGGSIAVEQRTSREYSAMMVRSNSVVSSAFGEFDDSRRSSSYNFGRRGSCF